MSTFVMLLLETYQQTNLHLYSTQRIFNERELNAVKITGEANQLCGCNLQTLGIMYFVWTHSQTQIDAYAYIQARSHNQ